MTMIRQDIFNTLQHQQHVKCVASITTNVCYIIILFWLRSIDYKLNFHKTLSKNTIKTKIAGFWLFLVTVWMIFSSLACRIRRPFFAKIPWNVDSSDQITCFHCVLVHLRWHRAQRARRHFCAKSINAFLFA